MSETKKKRGFRNIQEIKDSDKDLLTPEDIAQILKCDAYNINLQAHADPSKLGFPVCVMGNRVKIPRAGFIRWYEWAVA